MSTEQVRVPSGRLTEQYGLHVMLTDDDGHEVEHRIMVEWLVGSKVYAVLSPDGQQDADEWLFVYAIEQSDGEWQLESIDDEDEWEQVAEWVDEWLFEQQSES